MARAKRSRQQIERDLVEISRLYLRGYSHTAIAEEISANRSYSISQQTVSMAISELHKRWRESYLVDFDKAKAKELARLDELEAAYWDGWKRSMRDEEQTSTSTAQDQQGQNKHSTYIRNKVDKTVKKRDGSDAFLKGIERCINLRMRILGLYAPQQLNVNWRQMAEEAGIEESVANDQFEQLVDFWYQQLDGQHGGGGDPGS